MAASRPVYQIILLHAVHYGDPERINYALTHRMGFTEKTVWVKRSLTAEVHVLNRKVS